MKFFRRKGAGVVFLVFLLAIVLRLLMLITSCLYVPVTSDESITVLQARHIARGDAQLFVWAQPYQFPVEAYLMAPIARFLPPNAFGARFQAFVISFLSLAAMLMILRKMSSARHSWPAVLMILFPSAYLIMIQFGYPIPHYTSAFLFWWLAILSALHVRLQMSVRDLAMVFFTGLFCGLAFTNNMVSLAIVVPVAVVVCAGMGPVRLLAHTPVFAVGCAAGLVPYLVGKWLCPDAQVAVSGTRGIGDAFSNLWDPALRSTLPRTMGIAPGLFPDSSKTMEFGEGFMTIFAVVYLLILGYATLVCLLRIIEELGRKKWPVFTVNEIFVGASWLGLLLFMFSKRADASSYRYLAPAAWSFPFVLYYFFNGVPRWVRGVIGIFVICLACFNLLTVLKLINEWKQPDYAVEAVAAPDLKPALDFLRDRGIDHCVASHWAAYRINFLSDEKIICSQPHNERFPGWTVPYKEQVDSQANVAYVLTEDIRFLRPNIFERHMRTMRVRSEQQTYGRFEVYYDFEREFGKDDQLVPAESLSVSASNAGLLADRIADGNMQTFWRTDRLQEKGMNVEIDLPGSCDLSRMVIYYGTSFYDYPKTMRLEKETSSGWKDVEYDMLAGMDKFRFENGHPVYGPPASQTLLFGPVQARKIRLVIDEPSPRWAWTVNEVEIYKHEHPTLNIEP